MNILDIPYTHSGLLASALAMDKPMAKRIFAEAGLDVAEHRSARATRFCPATLPRPYVVKPLNEGSSVGVHIARDGDNEPSLGADNWRFGREVMVEAFVPGREFTVAMMGDRPLAVTEITTLGGISTITTPNTPKAGPSTRSPPISMPKQPGLVWTRRSTPIGLWVAGACPGRISASMACGR